MASETSEKTTIQLPNLVVSFLAEAPAMNDHYDTVSKTSREWLSDRCGLDARAQKMLFKGDFGFFCAITTPDCEHEQFKDSCDWVNWVFPFDDFFDDGELKDDYGGAKEVLDNLVDSMKGAEEPNTTFVCAHQEIFGRFKEKASPGNRARFINAIKVYANHVLRQVQDCTTNQTQKPEAMIELRRNSIGVKPLYAFVEYGFRIELPDEVFDHPLIKEIEILGIDWVLIQNDLISYPKDEEEGVNHNLISAC